MSKNKQNIEEVSTNESSSINANEHIKNILNQYNTKIDELDKKIKDYNKKILDLSTGLNEEIIKLEEKKSNLEKEIQKLENDNVSKINTKTSKIATEINSKTTDLLKEQHKAFIDSINKNREILKSSLLSQNELVESMNNDLESSLKTIFENAKKTTDDSIKIINEFDNERKKHFESINNKFNELLDSRAEDEIKRNQLKLKEQEYENKIAALDKLIELKFKEMHSNLENDLEFYKKQNEDRLKEINETRDKYDKLKNNYDSIQGCDITALKEKNDKLREENDRLKSKFIMSVDNKEYESIKQENESQANKIQQLEQINRDLKNQVSQKETLSVQLNAEITSLKLKKIENSLLDTRIKELEKEANRLSSFLEENNKKGVIENSIYRDLAEFENIRKNCKTDKSNDEIKWLNNIYNQCKDAGYKFSKKLIYAFHTSLKISDMTPLTVLAGVSGTGKSKLPQLYSKFGGLFFVSIPVKPDWDSPSSLLGYYNSIERKYESTEVFKALVMSQINHHSKDVNGIDKDKCEKLNLSNNVILILLDEMNLAHVELYFSDLLSKLEEKRGMSDQIHIDINLGNDYEPYHLYLNDNILWVGTMNEDETTKTLSDKVTDRGSIITFPSPTSFAEYNHNNNDIKQQTILPLEIWKKWTTQKYEIPNEKIKLYKGIVEEINKKLRQVNRSLGHRIWQSIQDYMSSHPNVLFNKDNKEDTNHKMLEKSLDNAFAEALVFKVMPKLRGIRTSGSQREKCLDEIRKILNDSNLDLSSVIKDFDEGLNSPIGIFMWNTSTFLEDSDDDNNRK